tara:strand:+ start:340 stop:3090 length:2751 start_codon:yes stop_codon:yes gene_type:complete
MIKTLTSNPELFSNLSWDLLLLAEDTAKKWKHSELNIEHLVQTLFTSREFFNFINNLSIDQNIVLDITENFLEENKISNSKILTIGEDLEILLDNANHIKNQWGSNLIEIPHLLIAIAKDERLGSYVFEEGNLSLEQLETELQKFPIINKNQKTQKSEVYKEDFPYIKTITQNSESNSIQQSSDIVLSKNNLNDLEFTKEINQASALSLYGKDLTYEYDNNFFDPVIGREAEINNLMRVLSRRNKNNPILIGQPGVGKSAITLLLAQLISKGQVPDSLKNLKLISLDFVALVSGTKFRGQLEERLRLILNELEESGKGIILLIDEIHTILNSDRSTIDIGSILKPLLTAGDLRCIGTTTPERFRDSIEKDQVLNNCFQKIFVNEPSLDLSSKILNGIKRKYEIHHGIKISEQAVNYAAKLASRYISDKYLPDKAIDLIDEAAAQLKIETSLKPEVILKEEKKLVKLHNLIHDLSINTNQPVEGLINDEKLISQNLDMLNNKWNKTKEKLSELIGLFKEEIELKRKIETFSQSPADLDEFNEFVNYLSQLKEDIIDLENDLIKENIVKVKFEVNQEDIADVVSKMTGIPLSKVLSNERKKLVNLEKEISLRVIGQDNAIQAISSAIRRARAGMKNPKRPIGSFLFMGPTGVGKTELAKSLASSLFDEEEALLRLDMSEYMERNAVARLLGAPPGYVGYEEGGQLTEAVRRKPYSVILLDEIEKAHTEVFNILLQVLDEGRLTDSQGSTIDFKNAVIIMTSNLAGQAILENKINQNNINSDNNLKKESLEKTIAESLSSIFRPEFLNRIDEIIQFEPLSKDQLQKIIMLQLDELNNLLMEQDISIKVDKKVIIKIANDSYEPKYGARSVNREIRRQIENPLATELLDNNFKSKKIINIKLDQKNKDLILFTPSPRVKQ